MYPKPSIVAICFVIALLLHGPQAMGVSKRATTKSDMSTGQEVQPLEKSVRKEQAELVKRAQKILSDTTLFSTDFAAKVTNIIPKVLSGAYGAFSLAVPEGQQPTIAAIKKKYGTPDKVVKKARGPSGPFLPEPPVDKLHIYGLLRFGVPASSTTGMVEWLSIEPPEKRARNGR